MEQFKETLIDTLEGIEVLVIGTMPIWLVLVIAYIAQS